MWQLLVLCLLTPAAWATSFTPAWLAEHGEKVYAASVTVRLGLGADNPTWTLRHTHTDLLVAKLQALHPAKPTPPDPTHKLLEQAPSPQDDYLGLTLALTDESGALLTTLTISGGRVYQHGQRWGKDPGRQLEYWLFSTARIKRDLLLASQVLPVVTFEQCRLLGNQIIATTPRQCMLPSGDVLLDLREPLTRAALRITTYDQCLRQGVALLYTFPRRCMVAGGRVITQPPVVVDPVAEAEAEAAKLGTPLQTTISPAIPQQSLKDLLDSSLTVPNLAPTTPSPTLTITPTTTISQPGLGFYTIDSTSPTLPAVASAQEGALISPSLPVSPTALTSPTIPAPETASLADLLRTLPTPSITPTTQP